MIPCYPQPKYFFLLKPLSHNLTIVEKLLNMVCTILHGSTQLKYKKAWIVLATCHKWPFPRRLCIFGDGRMKHILFCYFVFCVLIHGTVHNCLLKTMQIPWFWTMILLGHCLLLRGNDYIWKKSHPVYFWN